MALVLFHRGTQLPIDPRAVAARRTASAIDPVQLAAIDAGVKDGQDAIDAEAAKTFGSNGLFGSREELGANYIKRDVAAMKGLCGGFGEGFRHGRRDNGWKITARCA
jgi:hypothetical protein